MRTLLAELLLVAISLLIVAYAIYRMSELPLWQVLN